MTRWQRFGALCALASLPGVVCGNPLEKVRQAAGPSRQPELATGPDALGKGICVQIGCEDSSSLLALVKGKEFLVQGIAFDQATVEKARKLLVAENLYGQGSVFRLAGKNLPYADNLINKVIVEDLIKAKSKGISLSDIVRVTSPGGVVEIRSADTSVLGAELKALGIQGADLGTTPIRIVKPRPEGMDEWTHVRHGADGNPVSMDRLVNYPTGIQWLAGPRLGRGVKKRVEGAALKPLPNPTRCVCTLRSWRTIGPGNGCLM